MDEIRGHVAQRRLLTVSGFGFNTVNIIRSSKSVEEKFKLLDILVPEGMSIIRTSWLFGGPLDYENRITVDVLAPFLYSEAIQHGWGIYLLGGVPGVASCAAGKLRNAFPGLDIVGTHHGYLTSEGEKQAVIESINRSRAVIVLVGMGQPSQEEWIIANKDRVRASVLVGVGGYMDHVIRRIDCYPKWIYKWRLNWAYRLWTEPRRLWKRYTLGLLMFCARVFLARFSRLR